MLVIYNAVSQPHHQGMLVSPNDFGGLYGLKSVSCDASANDVGTYLSEVVMPMVDEMRIFPDIGHHHTGPIVHCVGLQVQHAIIVGQCLEPSTDL